MIIKAPQITAPHGFLDTRNGVSTGIYDSLNCGPGSSDAPENVAENRRRAAQMISDGPVPPLLTPFQVHGAACVVATEDWGDNRPKADAIVTATPGLMIGILTADCAPVLFQDESTGIVAAAHAGWRGAVAGVTAAAIDQMVAIGANRKTIHAAVGPCIAQTSYEVGSDMRSQAITASPISEPFFADGKDSDHFQFDLQGFVASILRGAGIASVWTADTDTYTSDCHFSFRRTTHRGEADYGRQVSAICCLG